MTRSGLQTWLATRLFDASDVERRQTYVEVRDSHQMRPTYLVMLVLAALVALFGLLANSPAVVIGAMLISPLMSPFLSAGLALATGDWRLGRAALRTIVLSVVGAVGISALAVAVSPLREATPEILARTSPNLLDLGIAFFSGFAGTYTLVSKRGGTTLPGVAIATAVMPPLCVVGFGAFTLDWRIAFGALWLFATNLAAIIISAACVFLLAAFRRSDRPEDVEPLWGARVRLAVSFGVLAVLSVPLALALARAAESSRLRHTVRAALEAGIENDPSRARLAAGWSAATRDDGTVVVDAAARTVRYFTGAEVDALRDGLARAVRAPVQLRLEQVRVRQGGLDVDSDAAAAARAAAAVRPADPSLRDTVRDLRPAAEMAASILAGDLERYAMTADEDGVRELEVCVRCAAPPSPDAVRAAEAGAATVLRQAPVQGDDASVSVLVRPSGPIEVDAWPAVRGRTVDRSALADRLAAARGFLAADPSVRVILRLEGAPERRALALRTAVLDALGVPAERVIDGETGSGDTLELLVHAAPPAPAEASEPARGSDRD